MKHLLLAMLLLVVPHVALAQQDLQNNDSDVPPMNAVVNFDKRIIGGELSPAGAYPWMVALVYNDSRSLSNRQFCGGTVIGARWILTASHCLFDRNGSVLAAGDLLVATGVTSLVDDTPTAEIVVTNVIIHPAYDNEALNPAFDVALLELANETGIEPVFVSKQPLSDLVGLTAKTMGWGAVDVSDPKDHLFPPALNETDIPIVSRDVCNAPISYDGRLQYSQLCAGFPQGGTDSCIGDSGGPLIATVGGTLQQVGVTSFGNGCAEPNFYGVYSYLPYFVQWINNFTDVGEPIFDAAQAEAMASGGNAGLGGNGVLMLLLSGSVLLMRHARRVLVASAVAFGLSSCMMTGNTQAVNLQDENGNAILAGSQIGDHYDDVMANAANEFDVIPQCEQRKIGLAKTRKAFPYDICSFAPENVLYAGAPLAEVVYHFVERELVRVDVSMTGDDELLTVLKGDLDSAFGAASSVDVARSSYQWPGSVHTAGLRQGTAAASGLVYMRLFDTALAKRIPWLAEE